MAAGEAAFSPRYTVTALTLQLKAALERGFPRVFVDGEISGWRVYPSGHAYFTLKDEGAQISAVMFASSLSRCKVRERLADGAKVLVVGRLSVYPQRGNYQLVVTDAKIAGVGELMQRYEELKRRLEAEGLFAAARKRPLPCLPQRIALVTSEAGAVVHDLCTVLTRRFPNLEIRLYPSLVQGEEAPKSLIAGVEYFNDPQLDWRSDVLIIGRGGGSFEDLFCFNDERLVRALAASRIPTVSAVGHETDFTLCDFVCDVRAGTPSIAAELVVPVKAELKRRLEAAAVQLAGALRGAGENAAQRLDRLDAALVHSLTLAERSARERLERATAELKPAILLAEHRASERLKGASAALRPAVTLAVERAAARLTAAAARLELLSPYGVLKRGYSLTLDAAGRPVRAAAAVKAGDELRTLLGEGAVRSRVTACE